MKAVQNARSYESGDRLVRYASSPQLRAAQHVLLIGGGPYQVGWQELLSSTGSNSCHPPPRRVTEQHVSVTKRAQPSGPAGTYFEP